MHGHPDLEWLEAFELVYGERIRRQRSAASAVARMAGLRQANDDLDLERGRALARYARTGDLPDRVLGRPERRPGDGPLGRWPDEEEERPVRRPNRAVPANPSNVETRVELKSDGNDIVLSSKGRICTLDDLLEASQVDPDEWTVLDFSVNKWDGMMKGEDGPSIVPLFQVKARLGRRPKWAVCPVTAIKHVPRIEMIGLEKSGKSSDLFTCVIVPDSQNGYRVDPVTNEWKPIHDRRWWDLAVQVCQRINPDQVICLGDMLDLAELGKFLVEGDLLNTTQTALRELHWWLGQLRMECKEMHYIPGNHEARWRKKLLEHVRPIEALRPVNDPKGHRLASIPRALDLDGLDINYADSYPRGEVWIGDDVMVRHGQKVSGKSGGTVSALIGEGEHTVVVGHIHRLEMCSRTITRSRGRKKTIFALSPGCGCVIDGSVPGVTPRPNWQQGLAVIRVDSEGTVYPELLSVQDGRTVHRGEALTGQDRIEEIREATGCRYL